MHELVKFEVENWPISRQQKRECEQFRATSPPGVYNEPEKGETFIPF